MHIISYDISLIIFLSISTTMFNNITNGIIYIFNTRILHTLAIHCNIPFPYLLFIYLLHIIFGCSFFSFKIPSRKSSSIYIIHSYISILIYYTCININIYTYTHIYMCVCVSTRMVIMTMGDQYLSCWFINLFIQCIVI